MNNTFLHYISHFISDKSQSTYKSRSSIFHKFYFLSQLSRGLCARFRVLFISSTWNINTKLFVVYSIEFVDNNFEFFHLKILLIVSYWKIALLENIKFIFFVFNKYSLFTFEKLWRIQNDCKRFLTSNKIVV